ncbi:MAG: transglycosylase SLT domain-containing protein [Acidobacteriota bacterium]
MTIRTRLARGAALSLLYAFAAGVASAQEAPQLVPTLHPALPSNPSDLWLVPSDQDRAARTLALYEPLVLGVARFQAGDYAAAIPLLSRPGLAASALGDYAAYYIALSQLRQGRAADARRSFEALLDRKPSGYVAIAAAMGAGEAAETAGDPSAAVKFYERAADQKGAITEDVLYRIGRAALAAGDRRKAADALVRVYYEFPLTEAATLAAAQLPALEDQRPRKNPKLDIARAQLLFGARRYTEARAAFQGLQAVADGDDREVADLRVAECDFYLKRYAAARDTLRPYLDRASRKAEARFFYLSSLRELGQHADSIALTTALVADFPDSSWSEEALNNLGTLYIVTNEDALATKTFKQLYEQFPTGLRAERAAWKYGWASYRNGDYAETVRVFESAALAFPRSDYRPPFLYWSARAHARLDAMGQAEVRLRLVYTDYANSYYGRLADQRLSSLGKPADGGAVRLASRDASPASAPAPAAVQALPTDAVIRLLLANGLYEDALGELRFAQRAWGNAPRLDATIAWIYHEKGELRRAISLMRRAYPQHLTAGGEELPTEILQVIYPMAYWDAIRRNAAAQDLDPYVVAALIAQESTFEPGVKSVANAWGLMQIVPATGRRLAQSIGIRKFTTDSLTNPDLNIRLGTLYFSRLVQQFGGTYYALASYNAGESRIVRWKAERPGLDEDEFIDDIPFPETQNYVKRILGTAADYRMLYGPGGAAAVGRPPAGKPPIAKPAVKKPAVKKPAVKKPAAKKPAVKKPAPKKKTPARRTPRG